MLSVLAGIDDDDDDEVVAMATFDLMCNMTGVMLPSKQL
jgi:hypothetical protein